MRTYDAASKGVRRRLVILQAAVVAIGDDTEASIFITALLVEAGVRYVVARAHTELHGLILERVGAHRVVYPENEAGEALARTLHLPIASQYLSLAPGVGITEVRASESYAGRTVAARKKSVAHHVTPAVMREREGRTRARHRNQHRAARPSRTGRSGGSAGT